MKIIRLYCVLLLLLSFTTVLTPVENKATDPWDDWGVNNGEEYEFSLEVCTRYGSTIDSNYTLGLSSNLAAIQGEQWIVTIEAVNSTGLFQTVTKGSITSPIHKYPTYLSWFWGQAGNTTYWKEIVDTYNDANYSENNPDLYLLDVWTLSDNIFTEHRIYKNSITQMKKFSINIERGILTEYELKYNETLAGDAVAYHHLKFSLLTDLEGGGSDLDNIIALFTNNPEVTIVLIGGSVLILGILLIRHRGGKKKSRKKR